MGEQEDEEEDEERRRIAEAEDDDEDDDVAVALLEKLSVDELRAEARRLLRERRCLNRDLRAAVNHRSAARAREEAWLLHQHALRLSEGQAARTRCRRSTSLRTCRW